ncbi:MAG: hypothetical protein ACFB50_08315 [Rubrobacteraceae bacterium]
MLALLVAFSVPLFLAPAIAFAQEGEESWDRDDPACEDPNPRSVQEAEEIVEKCNKTPEEKENDDEKRERAEQANEDDEGGQSGVPAGGYRNPQPGGAATPNEGQRDSADQNYDDRQDELTEPGGFPGMAVGAFKAILEWLYGVTVEKPSEEMTSLLTEEAFQMPAVGSGGIGAFYEKTSDLVKPGAVLVMLYVGYLMMFQGASYNANVAVQNVLPKIFIFFAMIGFLPDLLRMVSDLTSALSQTFVTEEGLEAFLSGKGSAGSHSADDRGFMVVLANIAAFVMMILVLLMCGIKNIVFTQLYILAPIPLLCWAIPQLSSVAAAWARGIVACLALPLLFAAEFAIGALMINNPGSVFGPGLGNDSILTAPVIVIVVLYVVWRTPKHLLSWVFSGHSASPGMVSQVVRAVVVRRLV